MSRINIWYDPEKKQRGEHVEFQRRSWNHLYRRWTIKDKNFWIRDRFLLHFHSIFGAGMQHRFSRRSLSERVPMNFRYEIQDIFLHFSLIPMRFRNSCHFCAHITDFRWYSCDGKYVLFEYGNSLFFYAFYVAE